MDFIRIKEDKRIKKEEKEEQKEEQEEEEGEEKKTRGEEEDEEGEEEEEKQASLWQRPQLLKLCISKKESINMSNFILKFTENINPGENSYSKIKIKHGKIKATSIYGH